jgi:hypothetical protein
MDVTAIVQVVSSLGFPIAVCLICFWYINKIEEMHRNEVQKLTDALSNNTLIMQKLCDKLGVQKEGEEL